MKSYGKLIAHCYQKVPYCRRIMSQRSTIVRICHVCNGHSVDDGRVFYRACVGLAEAGYEVHLFAVGGKTEAYHERGVTIHPLPECWSRKERFARRSRLARMAADLKPDLFHVHEPELLGPVIRFAKPRPVVYDVHESYLDVLNERDWIPQRLKPFIRFAWDVRERQLVQRCAGVVVVTERIAHRYYQLHKKVQVVANYPDLSEIKNLLPVTRDGMTCVYAGILRPDRGMSQIFMALAILKERGVAARLALSGLALSDGYLRSLWDEADRLGIRELVDYRGMLPSKQEALIFQQSASIALVLNQPVANYLVSMPNRLAECMALGLPLVFSDFPNFREVAGANGAGIAVDPTKPDQIANAIERLVCNPDLARQMGEAGRRAAYDRFNWNEERGKLLELYRDILGLQPCVVV
jgi:glycosyltransferase involved in cell wall biosynthesis